MFTKEERLSYIDAFVRFNQEPIVMDKWQELYISDASRMSVNLKCRQVGYSFSTALKGLVKANDPDRIDYTRQFVSYNEDDAKEKIRAASMLYHSIPKKNRKPLVSETKTSMEFLDTGGHSTSRLISIACRPPRGRHGDIVYDEMAIYPLNKARVIYTAGFPVISRGGCIEIGSTPLGKMGMFYDIFSEREKYKSFKRFNVPWWVSSVLCTDVKGAKDNKVKDMDTEARVKMFGTKTLQEALQAMFFEDFQQEYECTFVDSALSYITLDLLFANTPGMRRGERDAQLESDEMGEGGDMEVHAFKTADDLLAGYRPEIHGQHLFLGYDVARRRDAAVIFVIGLLPNGKKISVADIEMVNQPFEYQRDQIRKIMKRLPIVRGCIDKTGQGEDTTETLQKEFTSTRLEGIDFNTESKEVLAIGVREGLEKREFLLQNDDRFRRQVHSIKRIPSSGGACRYDSERDDLGHADSFWAWALANHAMPSGKEVKGFYQQYRDKRTGNKDEDNGAGRQRGKSLNRVLRGWGIGLIRRVA